MGFCINTGSIDWALLKDIVTVVATIGALVIGFFGLNTWRRQHRGTSEYEIAKNAVIHSYKFQMALQSVRNPMIHLSQAEVEGGKRLEEEQRIYQERLDLLIPFRSELQTIGLEAKVIWGDEARDCFDLLHQAAAELNAAIWMHFWLKGAFAGPGAIVDNNPDRVIENNKIVYFLSEEDEFSVKIQSAIKCIEEYYQPKVRGT